MIQKEGKEITAIQHKGKIISAVYSGALLVWQAVRSCFGAGFWRPDKPWISKDPWK